MHCKNQKEINSQFPGFTGNTEARAIPRQLPTQPKNPATGLATDRALTLIRSQPHTRHCPVYCCSVEGSWGTWKDRPCRQQDLLQSAPRGTGAFPPARAALSAGCLSELCARNPGQLYPRPVVHYFKAALAD